MPLIQITTSAPLPSKDRVSALLKSLSKTLATHFAKPERYVMTRLAPPPAAMTFGGTDEPACYVEVKNIGTMTPELTEKLSADITRQLSESLGVAPDRTYIEFNDAKGHLWGWNAETFG